MLQRQLERNEQCVTQQQKSAFKINLSTENDLHLVGWATTIYRMWDVVESTTTNEPRYSAQTNQRPPSAA